MTKEKSAKSPVGIKGRKSAWRMWCFGEEAQKVQLAKLFE